MPPWGRTSPGPSCCEKAPWPRRRRSANSSPPASPSSRCRVGSSSSPRSRRVRPGNISAGPWPRSSACSGLPERRSRRGRSTFSSRPGIPCRSSSPTYGRACLASARLSASTIEQLARVLLAQRGAPPTGPALVQVRPGGSRVPFVLLHGDLSGVGFYCRNLVGRLDPEQPFYSLPPHGSSGDPVPPTIEAMAEDYLAKLRAVVPDGPYQLGGFSHGGLIAFEMAWRLRAQGKHVALLVVIDRPVANPRWRLLRALVDGLGRPRGFGIAERRDAFLL